MKKRSGKLTEEQAEKILKKYSPDVKTFRNILRHGKAVKKAALSIAKAIKKRGHKVDLELIKTGSLLHDIGYFVVKWDSKDFLRHGVEGAKILRKEGLLKHAKIAERHIGAGLTKDEITKQKLSLPKKDFLPKTIEEKIICYADKLVFEDRIATVSEIVEKFKRKNLPYSARQRLVKLHNEIEKLRGGLHKL